MEKLLSNGAVTQILEGQKPANPVLQIIEYEPIDADRFPFSEDTEGLRYRLTIDDGEREYKDCFVTNQDIVTDIKNGRIQKWSIIRVSNFTKLTIGTQDVIHLLNLNVVKPGSEVGCKLLIHSGEIIQKISQTHRTITFEQLGQHLGVGPQYAERIVAQMIRDGRIQGYLNQIDGFVHFESKDVLQNFDEEIVKLCSEVNHIVEEIRDVVPEEWWTANATQT